MDSLRNARVGLAALAAVAISAPSAGAGHLDDLGSYERKAVHTALRERSLELEPAPDGKRIMRIHVVNLDVFDEDAGPLQVLNYVHRTTREFVFQREVLMKPGDMWNEEIVRETERNLRDPIITSLVVIVPVKSDIDGFVDVLVVTQDVWSIRTNSEFENQAGRFTKLEVALAENNFLGWRKHVSFIFDLEQGDYSLGPRYLDRNLAGSRLQLLLRPRLLFNRDTSEFEGTQSLTQVTYPLWSLERKWGALLEASHKDSVIRLYRGSRLATWDNPDTQFPEAIPYEYRLFDAALKTEVTRAVGKQLKYHITLGHELLARKPVLLPDFAGSDADAQAFTRDVLPRSELSSALVWRQRVFSPSYVTYRDIEQYDLPEVQQVGADVTFELAIALEAAGSDSNFLRYKVDARYLFDLYGETYVRVRRAVSGRNTGDTVVDNEVELEAFGATPRIRNAFRVIGHLAMSLQTNVEDNKLHIVGGDSGLRGYDVGQFTGRSFILGNVELRTMPRKLWFMRVGSVAFWDVGHAADSLDDFVLHNDIGFGLRVLAPQTGESIYRFDWALPFQGPSAGFPGRFSLGFYQAF